MDFVTQAMRHDDAIEVTRWEYSHPYDFYNMDETEETVGELMDGSYHLVRSGEGDLVGFYCLGASAQVPVGHEHGAYPDCDERVVDLGLGMRPDLTGHGLGREYLAYVLQEVVRCHPETAIRLTVATFNQRAIKLYRSFGFEPQMQFVRGEIVFQTMKRFGWGSTGG